MYAVHVCMWVCVCVCVCVYIMLRRPCNQWKRHISMFLPLISDCLRCCGKSWERCPAASFPSARVDGLLQMNKAAVSDLSQPSLDSCWAPCHGCLPYILNSLGGHFVVFGPCDRLRLQHTSRGVVYITQSHLDNLHFLFSFFSHFGGRAKSPKSGSECLEVSMRLYVILQRGVRQYSQI